MFILCLQYDARNLRNDGHNMIDEQKYLKGLKQLKFIEYGQKLFISLKLILYKKLEKKY